MDPRALLGVDPTASVEEIGRAYSRLAESMAARHAPDGLLLLLTRAREASLRSTPLEPGDPWALLGLTSTAERDAIHRAWRRVAALTHPDQGGTDELFRAVADAHDRLTRRGHYRHAGSRRRPPPSKPPPPGPFRAPPEHLRIRPGRRAAAVDLALNGAATAVIWSMAVLPVALFGLRAALVCLLVLPTVLWLSRPNFQHASWAAVRLRHDASATDKERPEAFLAACALDVPVGRETHQRLYSAYLRWCDKTAGRPLSQWEFVEELRSYGLLFVRISGSEEAIWVGLRLRDSSR